MTDSYTGPDLATTVLTQLLILMTDEEDYRAFNSKENSSNLKIASGTSRSNYTISYNISHPQQNGFSNKITQLQNV
ncbi:hypothetical protein QVD17_06983 [Tagetes erecta]|uniref:Uncharacterized protein n=1 Tax=Tagetes erecta TaxID=13708 RepID=A0AAD8LHY9_TARER|nr:hypothetical protein QVD17_06983 [Tagetes erecta]